MIFLCLLNQLIGQAPGPLKTMSSLFSKKNKWTLRSSKLYSVFLVERELGKFGMSTSLDTSLNEQKMSRNKESIEL